MKIAAIIVIYKPNERELIQNISKIIGHVDSLLLWYNSPKTFNLPNEHLFKITEMGDGINKFISYPLNQAINYCKENDFQYLLTMDQDSEWTDLEMFLQTATSLEIDNVAIYSPNINGQIKSNKDYLEVQNSITSGSLHNVSIAHSLGGFREDYQIYWVDGEFSYWAKLNNYKVLCLPKFILKHKFGNGTKPFLGISGANYSPIVYYYMFRNMIWMKREFGKGAVSFNTILYTGKLYGLGIIFCERNKLKKIFKIFQGIFEGLFSQIKGERVK